MKSPARSACPAETCPPPRDCPLTPRSWPGPRVRGIRCVPRHEHQPPAGAGVHRPAQRDQRHGPDRVRRQPPPRNRPRAAGRMAATEIVTAPARRGRWRLRPVRRRARAGRPRSAGCAAARGDGPAGHPAAPGGTSRGQPAARPARPRPGAATSPPPRPARPPPAGKSPSWTSTGTPWGTASPARARGTARPRPQRAGPTAPCALPARVTITVTEALLRQLQAKAPQPRPARRRGPGNSPRPATRRPGSLTLPGGQQLTVRFDVVPTYDCDHRYQGQLLPARGPAAPPGPGPRPRVHLAALLPSRPRQRLRARRSPTTRAERPTRATPAPAPAAATRSSRCPAGR